MHECFSEEARGIGSSCIHEPPHVVLGIELGSPRRVMHILKHGAISLAHQKINLKKREKYKIAIEEDTHHYWPPHMHAYVNMHAYINMHMYTCSQKSDCRDGLAVKSTCGFCRGSGCSSQHSQDDSQPPVTPAPMDPMT